MISIASNNGRLLRIMEPEEGILYGYHRRFGFVSEKTAKSRQKNRHRFGLNVDSGQVSDWFCQFRFVSKGKDTVDVVDGNNCSIKKKGDVWMINSPALSFQIASTGGEEFSTVPALEIPHVSSERTIPVVAFLLAIFFGIGLFLPNTSEEIVEDKKEPEPVIVKIVKPKRSVVVPVPRVLGGIKKFSKEGAAERKTRTAIKQNLGFLGVLGEKKLRKVLGGTPSRLKNASAGAGPGGGTEGSGGELLVGLGKGIRKTTVGNTGTVGLGGVGTKGRGGGKGGYGNAVVSSGVGKALGDIPLGQDVVMEGGLSEAVIEATIKKYLAQVQACYEIALRKSPGLEGVVATKFEIGATGRLNYSKVFRSTLGNQNVENCIVRNMKGWRFPRPEGGVRVRASHAFRLRPVRL